MRCEEGDDAHGVVSCRSEDDNECVDGGLALRVFWVGVAGDGDEGLGLTEMFSHGCAETTADGATMALAAFEMPRCVLAVRW